jgi:uncharacterized integral membrane protein
MADEPSDSPPQEPTPQQRHILLAVLITIAVVFALLNLDRVKVDFVFHSSEIPLIIVIVACMALGAAIDRLLIRRSRQRSK